MLRIYPVSVELVREIAPLIEQIERFDRDQARQLRRSSKSVVLDLVVGSAGRAGTKRARYFDAQGSARESLANLEVAEALGYIGSLDAGIRDRFGRVIGTLVNLVR